MAVRRVLCSAASLVLALCLAAALPLTASAEATVAFTISDSRITESSGLATDPQARAYWTVNDSGHGAVAYALNPGGSVIGTLQYPAQPLDVEAVAMHDGRLYVADIGDNLAERESITVYYFNNARADSGNDSYRSWDFTYPDGPHDAETLLVDDSGRLFVVTKEAQGAIYAAPRKPQRSGTNQLTKVGEAPTAVTDGTFLPGGKRIALLTYGAIEVIDAQTYKRIEELTMPVQRQPESLTVSLDKASLLVGSEGRRSKVYSVPIPAKEPASPEPTPADSSTASDPDSDQDQPTEADSSTGRSRAGTLMALGLAGIVAGVAGTVVGLIRRS
jgi:DNA-binding beta-propeller fold protein YncE